MSAGLSNAASAMGARLVEMDVIANNLANIATPGFRAGRVEFSSFHDAAANAASPGDQEEKLPTGTTIGQQWLDLTRGALHPTNDPLDVALGSDGFFAVNTAAGIRYTRNGHFTLSRDDALVTSQGDTVRSTSGNQIVIGMAQQVSIGSTGIVEADGKTVGQIDVEQFANPSTVKADGHGYYIGGATTPATDVQISQGFLEASNVQATTEMVRMMAALRSYEEAARTMQAAEEATQSLQDATHA